MSPPLVPQRDDVQRWSRQRRWFDVSNDDEAIYRELSGELIRYATALVGPDDAADILSTVVTRVLAKRRLSDLEQPKLYLLRAIGNEARSHQRQRSRTVLVQAPVTEPAQPVEPQTALDLVMELPIQQRAATYLVYWLGYQPTEAASVLGCRPGTLRRYLHLARKKLEEALDDQD